MLDQESYTWIRNQVLRFHRNKERILKSTYYGTNEKNLARLALRFIPEDPKGFEPSRNDIRFMLKIVTPALDLLKAKVPQEYNKRLPEDPERYQAYLTKAKNTVSMLVDLRDTLEAKL